MKRLSLLFSLLFVFVLAACTPQTAVPEVPTQAVVSSPTDAPTAAPEIPANTEIPPTAEPPTAVPPTSEPPTPEPLPVLTEALLKNATYQAPQFGQEVTLVDGTYTSDNLTVSLLPEIAFGDLDGDGSEDAAVLLAENGGGTGTFVSVIAMLNRGGQPSQAAARLIDDRPVVQELVIFNGEIQVIALIHHINDPMTSPTLLLRESLFLEGERLAVVRLGTRISSGAEHLIILASPSFDSEVSAPVQVVGNMPIGPFENNLAYHVYDTAGNLLDAGPFPVVSADMGAPATFNQFVASPAFVSGTTVWFELAELSMADGSPMSIAAVRLTIK